jgi:hypothetical protein
VPGICPLPLEFLGKKFKIIKGENILNNED